MGNNPGLNSRYNTKLIKQFFMKYIKTGQKRSDAKRHKLVMVDNTDFKYLNQFHWHVDKDDSVSSWLGSKNNKRTLIGRFIMNTPDNLEIDHIDGNRLNNQRSNLRLATSSQNKMNRGPRKDNKSGYKGVSWHKQRDKWTSRIMANGKYLSLGLFDNIFEAVRAYNLAAKKHHKEFAWLNQI